MWLTVPPHRAHWWQIHCLQVQQYTLSFSWWSSHLQNKTYPMTIGTLIVPVNNVIHFICGQSYIYVCWLVNLRFNYLNFLVLVKNSCHTLTVLFTISWIKIKTNECWHIYTQQQFSITQSFIHPNTKELLFLTGGMHEENEYRSY